MDIGYSVTNGSDPFECNRFRVDDSGPFSHLKQPLLSFSSTNGFSDGRMDGEMHRWCAGIKGLFTPAQWIELEHQAMIYKYLTANVPVPSNLLIPIRKAIQSAAFSGFSIGSFPSHSYGWGSFHLGFSSNSDSEPGRCRRTDGKKWRCSREAVPDQKYCERHINRGRHRSRKPVESHIGHTASAVPTTTSVMPSMSVSMTSLVTSGGGCFPNDVTVAQHQINMGLQPTGATAASTDTIVKCLTDRQGTSAGKQYSFEKQQISFEELSVSDFGIVSDDSLLNPSQKIPCFNGKNYEFLHGYDLSQQNGNPEWVQLSMSNPTTSFPNHEKISVSPSSLTRGFDPFQTGLGVEVDTKRNEWIPNSTGGGPLGEVLVRNVSTQLGSSRTGVL